MEQGQRLAGMPCLQNCLAVVLQEIAERLAKIWISLYHKHGREYGRAHGRSEGVQGHSHMGTILAQSRRKPGASWRRQVVRR